MRSVIRHLSISSGLILVLVFVNIGHAADHEYYTEDSVSILSTGEKMVLDALVLRPIGLVTTVAGSVIYTVSLPFSLLGGNEPAARETLIKDPARYTFKRPLGDLDY